MFLILLGIIIGAGLSVQTVINSRLRDHLFSPFLASTVSFFVGTFSLAMVVWLSGQSLFIDSELIIRAPFWLWIGGLLGVIGLTTNILLFPHLGAVQTAIMPILGQVIMSMLIDHFGWFHANSLPLSWNRIVGIVLVLFGIFLAVALSELRRNRKKENKSVVIWLWRLLGVVAGMLSAMQTAVNGELGRFLHSPVQAAFISFLVGVLTLILFVGIKEGKFYRIKEAARQGMPWWIWFGGILGAFFVFGSAFLMPLIGTGETVILALLGMISGSLLVDQYGFLNVPRKPVYSIQIIGLLILLSGVALIRLF